MGYISSLFARKVIDLSTAGLLTQIDMRRALYQFSGIDSNALPDHKQMLADTVFFELLEKIANEFEDGRSIAIRVGASMRCDDYGAFGLAFKTAVNLWGYFQRVERYGRVVTSLANFVVVPGDGSSFVEVKKSTESRLGLVMTNELAVAAATALSREVCITDFSPVAVFFSHEAPRDPSAHNAHFQCPVHYGSDRDGLEIANQELYAGNRLGDANIADFFDTHMKKELAESGGECQLENLVRVGITQALSEGVPKIADIAAQLAMSGRTLQRQLAEQGYAYQDLVDTARRDLADRLLRQSEYSLAEIAFMTGYAEQSTFTRAFKRWFGQSPGSYRQTH